MKHKILLMAALMVAATGMIFAQSADNEDEVIKIDEQNCGAYREGDLTFFVCLTVKHKKDQKGLCKNEIKAVPLQNKNNTYLILYLVFLYRTSTTNTYVHV